ncbi:MAG TPA: thioredoxin domain-containing protein [Massilibacterium sp.]|nr:thioredoxin domain-containing protein [Massilibacterium sp.]
MNKNVNWTAITILIIAVLSIGSIFLMKSLNKDNNNQEDKEQTEHRQEPIDHNKVLNYEQQPMLGNENAKIKVAEFSDYKCPACKYFTEEIFPQLKEDYIDTGKIQFYSLNLKFIGQDSKKAALIGEAIYQQNNDAYWKYNELIYKHQDEKEQVWASTDFLYNLIQENIPEIKIEQLKEDVEKNEIAQNVEQDTTAAETLQLQGTPALYINGVEVEDSMNYDSIKQALDRELEQQ